MKTETPLLQGFKLDQTFFGFNAEYQVKLHESLFEIIWAGEGRWDWETVYNLPIRIRKLWVANINKKRVQDSEDADQAEQDMKTINKLRKKRDR